MMFPSPRTQQDPQADGAPLADEHLAAVLNAAPVAMLVAAPAGRIVFANGQAGVTFGYPAPQFCSLSLDDLLSARVRSHHQTKVGEVAGLHASGREIPLDIGLTPLWSPTGLLAIAAIVDVTERNRRDADSNLARVVQQAMLPSEAPPVPGLRIAAASEPADAAGGDFYDYIELDGGRLAVVIGDASGHGFAAALVTVAARLYLRAYAGVEQDVSRILQSVNGLLLHDGLEGRFVTLFYAVLDPRAGSLRFAGAGHSAYVFAADGSLKRLLPSTGPPLGWFPEAEYPCEEMRFAPGDLLLLLTDGIEEAMAPDGEPFGRPRLLAFVRRHAADPPAEITSHLHAAVHGFQGGRRAARRRDGGRGPDWAVPAGLIGRAWKLWAVLARGRTSVTLTARPRTVSANYDTVRCHFTRDTITMWMDESPSVKSR